MLTRIVISLLAISLGAAPPKAALAATEQLLHAFQPGNQDGQTPSAPLVFDDTGGLFYGVTQVGGAYRHGTLFSITAQGDEAVLHSFGGSGDGAYPVTSVMVLAGSIYGTMLDGSVKGKQALGAVWSLSSSGVFRVLHNFRGPPDGEGPAGGLIAVGGDIYGTTWAGGANGLGAVYRVSASGRLKILYSFKGGATDGAQPWGGLVELGGRLYGTTRFGGPSNAGTVFEITRSGAETVLYAFKGFPDGANPTTGLMVLGGLLYGTTDLGGRHAACGAPGCGTVFEITPAGAETVLHAFIGNDGSLPTGGLTHIGKLIYGTTSQGGLNREGVAFSMTRKGHLSVLLNFAGGPSGANPDGLVSDAEGTSLYGVARVGGQPGACGGPGCGMVYSLSPALTAAGTVN